jgi:hypothetical protein
MVSTLGAVDSEIDLIPLEDTREHPAKCILEKRREIDIWKRSMSN